jgi:uncharacterized protein (DUF2267 family)
MEQLINLVVQRTGISPTQAQQAVQTVFGYLKDKLPGPLASQVESALGGAQQGGTGMTGQAQQTMGDLGGMTRPQ